MHGSDVRRDESLNSKNSRSARRVKRVVVRMSSVYRRVEGPGCSAIDVHDIITWVWHMCFDDTLGFPGEGPRGNERRAHKTTLFT